MLRTIPVSRMFALILALIMLLGLLLPVAAVAVAETPEVAVSWEDYGPTDATLQSADPPVPEDQAAFLAEDGVPGVVDEALTLATDDGTAFPSFAVSAAALDLDSLLATLAAGYVADSGAWEIIALAAYHAYQPGSSAQTSATARQTYLNSAIATLGNASSGVGDIAKAIIALQALGADPGQLYPVNSLTPFSAFDLLATALDSADFTYLTTTLPYALEALRQTGTTAYAAQEQAIKDYLLAAQVSGTGWGWGPGVVDEDSTAMVIAALAPYYAEPAVKIGLDGALAWLRGQQQPDGAFGSTYEGFTYYNASSTAQVILALCALGLDPAHNGFFSYDALDGLYSFLTPESDGFAGGDWEAQGFRALVAAAQFAQSSGPFDVYDFSTVATAPARATGAGTPPSVSSPPATNPDLTVTVTIKSDDSYWLNAKQVSVKEGSSVYHALEAALPGSGITIDGAASGYIKAITYNGVTLAEFSQGSGSGWLFKVNDTLPGVSILAYLLQDNDRVVVYFTEDWTKDPAAGGFKSGGGETEAPALGEHSDKAAAAVTRLFTFVTTHLPVFFRAEQTTLNHAVSQAAEHVLNTVKDPQIGALGGEWAIIGLARSGAEAPPSYFAGYYRTVAQYVTERQGVLSEYKYAEYSRVILALTALGYDPRNVAGYDLLLPLGDFEKTVLQGVNGPIWALIALDSLDYQIPENPLAPTQATRALYLAEILRRQLADGGWGLTGESSDPDVTAMALQALAKYQNQAEVKTATAKALRLLSDLQDAKGGYASWGEANLESVVQVLVALGELGIPVDDERFVKNGQTLVANILSYQNPDGSFQHSTGGGANNLMASEQALYGLVAAQRLARGQTSLYRMSGVAATVAAPVTEAVGLPHKHEAVKKPALVFPGQTFSDVADHPYQQAIEALAERGLISGKGETVFDPETAVTRAEFAALLSRGLGLPAQNVTTFTDVPATAWFAEAVGTAYYYELISGRSASTFDPEAIVTRQEAAVMLARAAQMCGMDPVVNEAEVRDILAQFSDYPTAASWAQSALALCYREGILDETDLEIKPTEAVKRSETAQMLYNLLRRGQLL